MFSYDHQLKRITLNIGKVRLRVSLDLQNKIIKCFSFFIKCFDFILPKSKKKVLFYIFPKFENNCLVFYNFLKQNHNDEFKFYFIVNDKRHDYKLENCLYLRSFIGLYHMYTSKYIVTTHASVFLTFFKSSRHMYLNLWHGMPIKTLGFCEKDLSVKMLKRYRFLGKNAHFFVTSDLLKQLMNSCFRAKYSNLHITGQPRTDIIGSDSNSQKIKQIFNFDSFAKVILYLPTWKIKSSGRSQQIVKIYDNIFGFDDFNEDDFTQFLKDNNILFITKPHPVEESYYRENKHLLPQSSNFKVLFNDDLLKENIDLYELFKHIDLMISDYSSVTIDYLILNKPVIYLNNLASEYSAGRGMILEDNFEILMPGKKVVDYTGLIKETMASIFNDDYKAERTKLLPLLHKYPDFNASQRVYDIMTELCRR